MKPRVCDLGPVMLDIAGLELSAEEERKLQHPLVGGVVLFSRNYRSPEQLIALCAAIHQLRSPQLLIAVDHEGGRVQRFRDGFTLLPAMRALGLIWDQNRSLALTTARQVGWVLAVELRRCGIDFSFAPVLDLDHGASGVIGDRAFHRDALAVTELAGALITGLGHAGMAAVGKHFPGHGYIAADSHHEVPVDERSLGQIEAADLVPFADLAARGMRAIMPAHVIYPKVDPKPAGFSRFWLQTILRERLGFDGVIFSDDLAMAGAAVAGGVVERARSALRAGCDMVLICNDPQAAQLLLDKLDAMPNADTARRLARMHIAPSAPDLGALTLGSDYRAAVAAVARIAG